MKTIQQISILLFVILLYGCNGNIKKEYYKNGNIKSELPLKGGIINGIAKYYYEDGSIKQEMPYLNGVKTGFTKYYYKDGKLNWECFYENDNYNGLFKEYNSYGTLITESNLNNGQQDGLTRTYYPNGKLKVEQVFINGKKEGLFKEYYLNNQLSMYAIMKNDTVIYFENFDSLGNFINDYRSIQVFPHKDKYNVGDIFKAKIVISGPKNYKSALLSITIFGLEKTMKYQKPKIIKYKNVSEVAFEANTIFSNPGKYVLTINVTLDRGSYLKQTIIAVEDNPFK